MLAKAADALSAGDLVNRKVRQYGSWGLMPFAAAIGSVYPATYMRGNRETYHPMETNWPRCALLNPYQETLMLCKQENVGHLPTQSRAV